MDRSHPCLRLDVIVTPAADIMHLWRTFCPIDRAFLRLIGTELSPTVEEYAALIQRPMPTRDIVAPNQFATIQSRLAVLLDLHDEEIQHQLWYGWEHNVRTAWLIDFIHIRSLNARGESYQRDTCHGFLLLIFGTILFLYSSNLIDGALAQVILQVVGGHSYVEAVLAETIRSLDYVREVRRGKMRGAPHLLQIWLLAHIRPFCSSHHFSYITDEGSLIAHLLQVFRPSDRDYTDWKRFMEGLTPAQFLWVARWNLSGPMAIGCPSVTWLPLISHLGSTLIFPARVIRQLGGLQDIPTKADRIPYRFMWVDTTTSLPDRFLRVWEVRRLWDTRIVQELYFPEHPTDDEQAFSATAAYVAQFHPHGLAPIRRLRTSRIPQAPQADIPDAESSIQGAMRTKLQSIREERDRLRCKLVDIRSELTDHRELQRELAQTRARDTPPMPTHSQTPLTQVISPPILADISTAHSGVPIGHPPPTAQTASNLVESARFTALEGMVNHLATNMATNMTELMAMLRNQNQASSSFTPPLEHRPIVDPNPTVTPTFILEVEDASFSAMAYAPTFLRSRSHRLLFPLQTNFLSKLHNPK
ncbi:hypothetical protein CRG98_012127 [Punica granatum]|uniref:DUF7745 domain-containing protein n=1 Tax=Punica granatum TaxID=22663 RepID=A0A2I0KH55_PUNGR|nr:hypothetical protein CRG98_012127 [Punica granatum]